jgi:poly-beta-1,6-N-acetyl-D-glucosamine N-deacetylase
MKQLPNKKRKEIVDFLQTKVTLKREAINETELAQISLSSNITIGAHTHSHPILTRCTDEEARNEIAFSKERISDWLGKQTTYFAYPNGDFGNRELKLMQELGFCMAFTTQPGFIGKNNVEHRFALPRLEVLSDVSFAENICRMTGNWFGLHNNKH